VTLPEAPYAAMLTMLHAEGAAAFDQLLREGGLPQLTAQGDGDWPNTFRAARAIPAAEYLLAARRRTQLCADMHAVMADVDVLVAPTHGGATLTCTNLTGHPTLVLPIGRGSDGKPTVLGLTGKLFGEAALLAAAEQWQDGTDFHRTRPELTA
jgi:Asp-tRNA(Asn)/Glu-tRNA(Gln) amidotransferase A subunit family amidase